MRLKASTTYLSSHHRSWRWHGGLAAPARVLRRKSMNVHPPVARVSFEARVTFGPDRWSRDTMLLLLASWLMREVRLCLLLS